MSMTVVELKMQKHCGADFFRHYDQHNESMEATTNHDQSESTGFFAVIRGISKAVVRSDLIFGQITKEDSLGRLTEQLHEYRKFAVFWI